MRFKPNKHFRHTVLAVGSVGILLSSFFSWVSILGKEYNLFELGKFIGTWSRYESSKFLQIIGIAYFAIPIFACLILMTLIFRKSSRIIAFIGGFYSLVLTGALLMPISPYGLPEINESPGIYLAFVSSLIIFIGSIFSKIAYEEIGYNTSDPI